jgi:hypothetical protein
MSAHGPPGWYPDPEHPGQMRWWDGTHWRAQAAAVGPARESEPDSFAIASLVTGLLGLPIAPVYLALRARKRIRESGGTKDGEGLALVGLCLGLFELAVIGVIATLAVAA